MSQHLKEQLEQARDRGQEAWSAFNNSAVNDKALGLAILNESDFTEGHKLLDEQKQILDTILHDMSRPFDPTKASAKFQIAGWKIIKTWDRCEIWNGARRFSGPWPSSHFAGEQLLISLGVVEK